MTTTLPAASTAAWTGALAAGRSVGGLSPTTLSSRPSGEEVGGWATGGEVTDPSTRLAALIGGRRGVIDGALPSLVFVVVNAIATTWGARSDAVVLAIAAALSTAAALAVLRLARKESLKQAIQGLAGLLVAVAFALRSGEARDFFLPGIYVDAAYAAAFAISALAGRPLVATIHRWIFGGGGQREQESRLRRAFMVTTVGWSLVYASRVVVQAVLYRADQPGIMAASKILMGWPLTIVAVALTLAYIRSAHTSR